MASQLVYFLSRLRCVVSLDLSPLCELCPLCELSPLCGGGVTNVLSCVFCLCLGCPATASSAAYLVCFVSFAPRPPPPPPPAFFFIFFSRFPRKGHVRPSQTSTLFFRLVMSSLTNGTAKVVCRLVSHWLDIYLCLPRAEPSTKATSMNNHASVENNNHDGNQW